MTSGRTRRRPWLGGADVRADRRECEAAARPVGTPRMIGVSDPSRKENDEDPDRRGADYRRKAAACGGRRRGRARNRCRGAERVGDPLFDDVPDASPHHEDVGRIAGAGITAGCTPTLYLSCRSGSARPDGELSRTRARTYRVDTRRRLRHRWPTPVGPRSNTLTITTGGVPVRDGVRQARRSSSARIASTAGCPCAGEFRIRNVTDNEESDHYFTQNDAIPAGSTHGFDSTGLTWVVQVVTERRTRSGSRGGEWPLRRCGGGVLTAVYAPFGSTGTSAP